MAKKRAFPTLAHSINIRWLAGLLLGIFCTGALAATEDEDDARWYQVELILFTHNNPQALDAEQWPEIIGIELPLDKLVELHLPQDIPAETGAEAADSMAKEISGSGTTNDAPAEMADEAPAMPAAFQILDENEWQLTKTARHLQRSSRFKPLLHVAWRQPTHELARAHPVLLYDSMTKPLEIEEQTQTEDGTTEESAMESIGNGMAGTFAKPVYATEDDARIGPPDPRLIGTVKLSVARYLHLATNLVYRIPVTQQAAVPVPDFDLWYDRPYPTLHEPQGPAYQLEEWQAIRGFRMRESRRMRSKVLHYLDHPLFGMVVLITPVELPRPEEAKATVTQ